ncbi:OmpA/MotB [Hydrogenophaga taeniospiralis CCUG 15921]|uniref:OmpA/MotB n=1 Tax=Hydrogenophaga taeniospiralis CCUG 15921 TaxID=1281780 RepID=A0A9X4NTQ1_9BURK|nr:OmpA family protein [Hydrogenophaga taeniospiralis]MDG5977785.1 OmpA/MotB [Hydrogenophaga taeniospiralis CCUG 15921]
MKQTSVIHLLGLAGLATFLASSAYAQDTSHFYGGGSVGQSRMELDAPRTTGILLPGVNTSGTASDEKDTAFKVFGGYQFNRSIAIEGGYFDLGKSRFTTNTAPSGTLSGETRVQGLNLDVVGTIPLTERFSALARVGAQHAWSEDRFSGTGAGSGISSRSKHNDTNYKVGLGVQYAMSSSVWIRGELERYRLKNATGHRTNADVVSVSLVFPFGRAPVAQVAAAPVYVAPAPMPEPVAAAPMPAPVAPAPQRVSFSADTLFGFDKATVRPEGKAELDRFSDQLGGTSYQSISVEGHTDRLGSTGYNQTLSDERAASVRNYLVNSGKVDPTRISAVGKSESQPVTAPGDCTDRQSRAQLINCLQPDRRVEVEVNGTR